jgi:hypothetical protein
VPKTRRLRTSAHRTKRVIVRSMYEHVQGETVKFMKAADLPKGCCHLVTSSNSTFPYPCTLRMTHVAMVVEQQFVPKENETVPVLKMKGYCRTHRPKRTDVIELPRWLMREVNGPRGQKARIRRMEQAMYLKVVPSNGSNVHYVLRSSLTEEQTKQAKTVEWVNGTTSICGKNIKDGYLPLPVEIREDYGECASCLKMKEVVQES